jgi:flagellar biosynthesis anti-sigma factor FlgM
VEVLKIRGSQAERIRALYKKAARSVQTSETPFAQAVGEANDIKSIKKPKDAPEVSGTRGSRSESPGAAQYEDVLARVDERAEEVAVQAVARAPDIRKAKVEALAEAIKKGTYGVDYEAVAERLLASGVLDDND